MLIVFYLYIYYSNYIIAANCDFLDFLDMYVCVCVWIYGDLNIYSNYTITTVDFFYEYKAWCISFIAFISLLHTHTSDNFVTLNSIKITESNWLDHDEIMKFDDALGWFEI